MQKFVENYKEISDILSEKINEGESKFLKPIINNQSELEQLQTDYNRWKSFNVEYLETIFSNKKISYEYNCSGISLEIRTFRTPFQKHIEYFKKEVKSNIEILKQIVDKIPLYEIQEKTSGVHMNFLTFCKDRVTLLREDGSIYSDLPAQVNEKMILIPNADVPIALGDIILRQLPNGIEEKFTVTNPVFYNQQAGMPAHYQVKFRRGGDKKRESSGQINITIGDNSHLNMDSVDYSVNSSSTNNNYAWDMARLAEELEQLRGALISRAQTAEHYTLIGAIASAETAATAKDVSKLKQILSSLGTAAQWVLNTAKEISVPILSEILKTHIQ